ncbi:MAG: hypothetical protein Q9208_004852 [Pyrenodesmia sp. 3 TL-2023]
MRKTPQPWFIFSNRTPKATFTSLASFLFGQRWSARSLVPYNVRTTRESPVLIAAHILSLLSLFRFFGHFISVWKRFTCKRIKRTLISHCAPKASATVFNNTHDNNTAPITAQTTGGESPPSLHRSNAIRRVVPASRSGSGSSSSSPRFITPTRLRVRNTTPSPTRPTSIVPTLMLHNTPSTNQTSLSRSTAPTSPSATTFISSVHHLGHERPTTMYMVDGVAIDSEAEGSPPYELRCVDAYRRVVVDVVEGRRSGRLTVVNGDGRASLDTVESREDDGESAVDGRTIPPPPPRQQQQQRQPEMVQVPPKAQRTLGIDVLPVQPTQGSLEMVQVPPKAQRTLGINVLSNPPNHAPPEMVQLAPSSGPPTKRALLEDTLEENKQEPQTRNNTRQSSSHHPATTPIFTSSIYIPNPGTQSTSHPPPLPSTPIRRRPLPSPPSPSPPTSPRTNSPPIPRKPVPLSPLLPRATANAAAVAASPRFSTSPQHQVYYQRRKRPMARPPIPTFPAKATEGELLAEVEGVRRLLDGRDRRKEEEEESSRKGKVEVEVVEREWDWFWVDGEGEGGVRYWRGGLPVVDVDVDG